ncbi:coiled-coil domain-containing protein 57 [Aplysia californica]|uniref:Coiled-coil domain-containing protein 57 n=1 Tax=Aplysia californica TaxID=6500 RepID=A0ABM1A5N1_APLCA|nr:coiled-coil domain-containing protein 57 [Aplysia californica]
MANADSGSWKILADKKEKEWRGILESRIESLEATVKEKDKELESQKEKFTELKDHFKYNLRLLEERDRELEKYDATYADIRTTLNSKNAEISELKIQLDDFKNIIKREERSRDELQSNYQRRLREKQAEVDSYKSCKDGELQEERKEYEQFRRNLQLQLTNLHNELDTQKKELTTEFENELKKREHEFRVQSDELHAKVLEHDLKAKLLAKELELARDSHDKTTCQAQEAESSQRELEKLVKQKEWELADVSAVKDSNISELEHKVSSCEAAMKKMQEDFQRKYTEIDKMAREREELIERAKNGYLEREKALQEINQDLQSKLEDSQIRERQLTWNNQDLAKEKEIQIEKLQEEISEVKEKWDRHVAEISRENVSRDLELGTALEEQRRLKLELEQRKDDMERYKTELKAAADREEKLDKSKTQTELDWQRRCEDLERAQYDKSEDLIKKLTVARNEALALVKERERELQHKIFLVKSLHCERDQLRLVLKNHGIPLDNFVKYSVDTNEDEEDLAYVEDLQKQNTSLKELIGQMRTEMETLGQGGLNKNSNAVIDDDSWVQEELQHLRKENKDMKEKLKRSKVTFSQAKHSLEDSEEILSQVQGNAGVKNHILALNETVGVLRSEKVELAATVKKQQARLAHLETSLEDISTQPRQKQIQIDQLNYELSSQRRRHEGEVTGLKNRVSDLELQLSEARREADEYHRASLERNQELVALGNQLSALKMEKAEANPSINFGAQELYIQQLQSELSQLRKRATVLDASDAEKLSGKFDHVADTVNHGDLKYKLKSAAAKIVQLAKENQQLIESNNRLRAQLKNAGNAMQEKPFDKEVTVDRNDRRDDKDSADFDGRLSQLEKLQYQLTRQELQFARRFQSEKNKTTSAWSPASDTMDDNKLKAERDLSEPPTRQDFQPKQVQVLSHTVPVSRPSRGDIDPHMLMSMSSGGGESIQKVWQMLEESVTSGDPSSSPPSPRAVISDSQRRGTGRSALKKSTEVLSPRSQDRFQLEGQPAASESKSGSGKVGRAAALKYAENVRKLSQPKPKVRNYNVRDGSGSR